MREITPEGVANTYEQLRKQMGLPIKPYEAFSVPAATNAQLSVAA